jgi:hypothetical protein
MRGFKGRIMRVLPAVLLLALLSSAHMPSAQAQATPGTSAALQLRSCHKVCFTEGEKCATQDNSKEPVCNTLEIGCVASCDGCIGGFAACMTNADKTPRVCQNSFDACLEQKLTASRSRARPQIAFTGGDGQSRETAVVIEGAMDEFEGLMAENLWAIRHHPQWVKHDQALIASDGKHFDKINYQSSDGTHTIWYDVSGFLGK